jgi:aspartyl protease family protein
MKVVTIGRDTDNDIVVYDGKASRHHVQIISSGADNYRIVDLNSSNGTFVNDRKIQGETTLFATDMVRIGNTTLPWQSYFAERRSGNRDNHHSLVWIAGVAVAAAVAVILFFFVFDGEKIEPANFDLPQKVVVKMHEENGVCYIPMKVNGQELNFVFDTGASSICISVLEAAVLGKNGLLVKGDIIGQQEFQDATGGFSIGMKINLKKVEIGGKEVDNVEATIIDNPGAECLLGQSVLSRFGKYTIDNRNNEIIFE